MSIVSHLTLFICIITQNEASRILAIFPTPSISHQVVFRPLILALVDRGHEVVMLTTDPIFEKGQSPSNLTEIDVHDASYKVLMEYLIKAEVTTGSKGDLQKQMTYIFEMLQTVFEAQLMTDEMQRLLKDESEQFDLLMTEAYFNGVLGLTHIFKNTPVIQVSSFGAFTDNLNTIGAPMHPLVHPTSMQQRVYDLTALDKIAELHNYVQMNQLHESTEDCLNRLLKRVLGSDVPDISELKNNVDMLFLNVHPIWEMNRPVPPNVIYMGGLHQKPEKELPQELKTYLDSSKHGVIYISFGNNVEPSLLAPEKIQALINAFSKLPYDVLWKWNTDVLPGRTKNIKIAKWLPQSDLLKHPKIKLFITQGGLQSTDEAIAAGVPLIGIPMLGDQWYNVEQYVHHKIGLMVYMDTITDKEISNAIQTILKDDSYRENIVRLRTVMRDQPESPLQRAIWWTEYVLRHKGAKHLRSPSANMSTAQYFELELVLYLLLTSLSVITVVGFVIYYMYSLLNKQSFTVKVKGKKYE